MVVKDFMSQLWEALAITILLAEIDCKPLIAVTENDLVNTPENSQLTFIFFQLQMDDLQTEPEPGRDLETQTHSSNYLKFKISVFCK